MGLLTFKGGIHPSDMKYITCEKQIIELDAPDILTFPLSQHIGAPAVPCVKVGDTVNMGQKIAEASAAFSAISLSEIVLKFFLSMRSSIRASTSI